jgi:hypothetical protein
MARSRRTKGDDKNRFYLLPGQGGRAHRRKQWRILAGSLIAALVVAGIMAGLMYWMSRTKVN